MRKSRYSIAVEIGKNLPMTNATLDFIKKHDPELYRVIMPVEEAGD